MRSSQSHLKKCQTSTNVHKWFVMLQTAAGPVAKLSQIVSLFETPEIVTNGSTGINYRVENVLLREYSWFESSAISTTLASQSKKYCGSYTVGLGLYCTVFIYLGVVTKRKDSIRARDVEFVVSRKKTIKNRKLRGGFNMPGFSGVCFALPRNVIWPTLSGPNCLMFEFKKNGGLRCQLQLMRQLKRYLWLKS